MSDEMYRTCPECGADLNPIPAVTGERIFVEFSCAEHGIHTLIDPLEGKR